MLFHCSLLVWVSLSGSWSTFLTVWRCLKTEATFSMDSWRTWRKWANTKRLVNKNMTVWFQLNCFLDALSDQISSGLLRCDKIPNLPLFLFQNDQECPMIQIRSQQPFTPYMSFLRVLNKLLLSNKLTTHVVSFHWICVNEKKITLKVKRNDLAKLKYWK